VSPVLYTSTYDKAFDRTKNAIIQLYEFMDAQGIELLINESCSTHVHLSPRSIPTFSKQTGQFIGMARGWDLERVKRVCVGSFFFEPAITGILPPHRQHSEFAEQYRDLPNFLKSFGSSLNDFKKDAYGESKYIIQSLQEMKKTSRMTEVQGGGRYWGWNFKNLVANKLGGEAYGTIEFRRPPGSPTAEDALMWIEFATTFTVACIEYGDELYAIIPTPTTTSVSELTKFLVKGAKGKALSPKLKNLLGYNPGASLAQVNEAERKGPVRENESTVEGQNTAELKLTIAGELDEEADKTEKKIDSGSQ
jgi:hypothetical protein